MVHYKAIIAYDGTLFQGFQRQRESRTVQLELETALSKLGWNGKSILAAGRTDAGVHATGQVVSFMIKWNHDNQTLKKALNANLPADIVVLQVDETKDTFHPRYDAISRRYQYHIVFGHTRDPFKDRYAWWINEPLDLVELNSVSREFVGVHNFRAFGVAHKPGGSTIRKVMDVKWFVEGDGCCFDITANAFLYHMVRKIVYFLISVGRNISRPETLTNYLERNEELEIKGIAPPEGLFLIEVAY